MSGHLTVLCLMALGWAGERPLAIVDITVVDTTLGTNRTHMTVVIRGERIDRVGTVDEVEIPPHAVRVQGTNQYLIPGLWDMHIHLSPIKYVEYYYAMLLSNGVTGARHMGSDLPVERYRQLRDENPQQGLPTPRLVFAGPVLDGPAHYRRGFTIVRSGAEARQAVNRLVAGNVDFIKVYSSWADGEYFAIAAQSRLYNIPFAGHVPMDVTAAEASDAGQKRLEHLLGICKNVRIRKRNCQNCSRFLTICEMPMS